MPDDVIVFEDGPDGLELRRGPDGSISVEMDGPDGECGVALDREQAIRLRNWIVATLSWNA